MIIFMRIIVLSIIVISSGEVLDKLSLKPPVLPSTRQNWTFLGAVRPMTGVICLVPPQPRSVGIVFANRAPIGEFQVSADMILSGPVPKTFQGMAFGLVRKNKRMPKPGTFFGLAEIDGFAVLIEPSRNLLLGYYSPDSSPPPNRKDLPADYSCQLDLVEQAFTLKIVVQPGWIEVRYLIKGFDERLCFAMQVTNLGQTVPIVAGIAAEDTPMTIDIQSIKTEIPDNVAYNTARTIQKLQDIAVNKTAQVQAAISKFPVLEFDKSQLNFYDLFMDPMLRKVFEINTKIENLWRNQIAIKDDRVRDFSAETINSISKTLDNVEQKIKELKQSISSKVSTFNTTRYLEEKLTQESDEIAEISAAFSALEKARASATKAVLGHRAPWIIGIWLGFLFLVSLIILHRANSVSKAFKENK